GAEIRVQRRMNREGSAPHRTKTLSRKRPSMPRALQRSWLVLLALGWIWTSSAAAQAGGQITGSVVDAETLQPLATVQVFIQGTSIGALTGAGGQFTLVEVPAGTH